MNSILYNRQQMIFIYFTIQLENSNNLHQISTLLYDFIHNPLLDQIKLVNNLELQKIIYCNVSHPPPFSTNKNKQWNN